MLIRMMGFVAVVVGSLVWLDARVQWVVDAGMSRLPARRAEAAQSTSAERHRENESKVSSLTARLTEERERTAPLVKSRQNVVDKLNRRIDLRTAHREARLSVLFPGDTTIR